MTYEPIFESIAHEIDRLITGFSYQKKDIGYGYRRTLQNKQRIDLIDYKKKGKYILRVGRGARLVRQYPVLYSLFDEVMKVIAKFQVHSLETLHEKNIIGLMELLHQAPRYIKTND